MRPLPVEALAGTADPVRGVALIRGRPTPVLDLKALLDGGAPGPLGRRFVTLRIEDRVVALAVDDVIGVHELDPAALGELPPLLHADSAERFAALGTLDQQLLVVLSAARLVPDEVWAALAGDPVRS
jgi:purine-binding chemotaxis protein CheW